MHPPLLAAIDAAPPISFTDEEIGSAAEELARISAFRQGMHGRLPFKPGVIGSHWSRKLQADVVGMS